MQEYWVNVHETCLTKTQFLGNPMKHRFEGVRVGDWQMKAIYRIHVKMKPVKRLSQIPKYDQFDGKGWMELYRS